LERGGRVILLDKNAFLGGNSTRATSGINGAGTSSQRSLGVAVRVQPILSCLSPCAPPLWIGIPPEVSVPDGS